MTTSFTDTGSWGKGAQDVDNANEIITAYIERKKALNQSVAGISLLSIEDNAQSRTIWNEIQSWMEINCQYFVDSTGPLVGNKGSFLFFTKATWQAAAGLNVSAVAGESYRRKTSMEDSFSYGSISSGDIRGDWCFEDLQNGFNKLKWTRRGGGYEYPSREYKSLQQGHPHGNLATFIANWNATAWVASGGDWYTVRGNSWDSGGGYTTYYAVRSRATQSLTLADLPRKIDIYIRLAGWFSIPFLDYDGLGFVENEFHLYREESETSDVNITLDYIGNDGGCPLGINSGNYAAVTNAYIYYLIKWSFTNGE